MPRANTESMRAQNIARKDALFLSKLKSKNIEGLAINLQRRITFASSVAAQFIARFLTEHDESRRYDMCLN
jgi:hypothetical protein